MIVIYFVLFNLKRNRVKHWLGNTAESSYEICIFRSLTCCYWWWFNSTMNCISSLYAGLFCLGMWQCQVLWPWLCQHWQFWTQLCSSNVLPSCPLEFSPQKLTGPVETELRGSSSFLWAVRPLPAPAAELAGCFGRPSLRRPLLVWL